jgi:hypothetical protein
VVIAYDNRWPLAFISYRRKERSVFNLVAVRADSADITSESNVVYQAQRLGDQQLSMNFRAALRLPPHDEVDLKTAVTHAIRRITVNSEGQLGLAWAKTAILVGAA